MDASKYHFMESHEWVAPDGTVGISDHAQKEITDVVFVELPTVGRSVAQGEEVGTVESVKAAFPIYAPASGKIIAVNESLAADPAKINQSAYNEGWIYKLELTNPNETKTLMDLSAYENFLKTASH